MNFEIGNIENVFSRIAAHTAAEGAMEGIRGGHVEHGLLMGLTSSTGGALINKYGMNLTYAERVAVNATLGGVVSELGGGKFASGAMTAAYSMMFNDLKHNGPYYRHLKKIMKFYNNSKEAHGDPHYFYESLGGEIAAEAKEHPGWYDNACAARLSYAMNEAGMTIPYVEGQTLKGSNNRNYFIRAIDMRNYFEKIWGAPRIMSRPTKIKNGIVYQSGFTNVTGHVDLFFNGTSGGAAHLYYWNTDKKHENISTIIWKYGR